MNKQSFFSIIIPTFNRAEQLRRALASIDKQTFKDFEVIVCDDGSNDHTKEVVDAFHNNFELKYIYGENWGGPAQPRNNGLKIATGKHIAFLDSDDWWYPNKLEVVSEQMHDADVSYHDLEVYSPKGKSLTLKIKGRHFKQPFLADILKNGNVITTSSVTIRRDFIRQLCLSEGREAHYAFNVGTISKAKVAKQYPKIQSKYDLFFENQNDEYLILKSNAEKIVKKDILNINNGREFINDIKQAKTENFEDFDLWLRLSMKARKIVYIPKSLGAYWVGQGNRSEAADWYINGFTTIYHRYMSYLGKKDQEQAQLHMSYIIGRCKHQMNKNQEALEHYAVASKTNNLRFKFRSIMLMLYLWILMRTQIIKEYQPLFCKR